MCTSLSRLGELQQGTLALRADASPPSSPSASASASASRSLAAISHSKAKSLAAFEQFVKARTWTNAKDSDHVLSSGRIARNLQSNSAAATTGVAAEASTSSAALGLLRTENEKEI